MKRRDRLRCGILGLGALVAAGCSARYVRAVGAETVEATPERLVRGGYLVNQVCACGACHTTRESGNIARDPELLAAARRRNRRRPIRAGMPPVQFFPPPTTYHLPPRIRIDVLRY